MKTSASEARCLRRLGGFFFGQAKVEGSALGCINLLVESDALTDAERRFLLERMRRDELLHGILLTAWAKTLGGTSTDALAGQYFRDIGTAPHLGGELRLAHALMVIRVGEDQVLRSFPLWSKRLQEWQPELAQDLGALLADERDHARVSRDIAERWALERPTLARIHAPRYTEARRVYTVLAGAVTAPIWREIEACLT